MNIIIIFHYKKNTFREVALCYRAHWLSIYSTVPYCVTESMIYELVRSLFIGIPITHYHFAGDLPPCVDRLGIEAGNISDSQLSSSSNLENDTDATYGRLNQPDSAWIAGINDENQWIQVGLLQQTTITGVLIQGNPTFDRWVSRFQIQYSLNNVNWLFVKNDAGTNEVS